MSWDAQLVGPGGIILGEWNYTHNTNVMIDEALARATGRGTWFPMLGRLSWWARLDGLSGIDGGALLHPAINELRRDPDYFRAWNPENGWGDYDSLLTVLDEMAAAITTDLPTEWRCSG